MSLESLIPTSFPPPLPQLHLLNVEYSTEVTSSRLSRLISPLPTGPLYSVCLHFAYSLSLTRVIFTALPVLHICFPYLNVNLDEGWGCSSASHVPPFPPTVSTAPFQWGHKQQLGKRWAEDETGPLSLWLTKINFFHHSSFPLNTCA